MREPPPAEAQALVAAAERRLAAPLPEPWRRFALEPQSRRALGPVLDALHERDADARAYLVRPTLLCVRGADASRYVTERLPEAREVVEAELSAVHRFGGEAGLEIAYEHFTADTRLLCMLDGDTPVRDRLVISARLIDDLIGRYVGDRWEAWDIWAQLAELTGHLPAPSGEETHDARLVARSTDATPRSAIDDRAAADHRRLIERYRVAMRDDSLLYGVRQIVPHLVLAHWTRWGVSTGMQRALACQLEDRHNPRPRESRRPLHREPAPVDRLASITQRFAARTEVERTVAACAAARCLEHEIDDTWLQCSLQAPRAELDALLSEHVGPFLREAGAFGEVREAFFMRKEPGLRVRLRGPALRRTVVPELQRRLRAAGIPVGIGPYDAERFQFGGHHGLALAHALFSHDSQAICAWLALPGSSRTDPLIVSCLLINALIGHAVAGPEAERRVWQNMWLASRLPGGAHARQQRYDEEIAGNQPLFRALYSQPESMLEGLEPDERAVLEPARTHFIEAGRALRAAAEHHRLSVDLETILPFLLIFHWNRLGLPLEDHFAISYSMNALFGGEAPT